MKREVPEVILKLIERFHDNYDAYRRPEYNETQTRREFIDPLLKALGWDVDNEKDYSEQFKEVIHEDAIKIGGVTKAPDYSFRLGGKRLFFLEAKKPSVNLKEDPAPAYQLRRYAWTAKLALSILTDFEEFIVYDTRVKPALTDSPAKARILYLRYQEYPDRWNDICSIFSPVSIQKGGYDRFIQSSTQKRGTAEVDDALLAEIEEWREQLARNTALRNPGLKARELNFAVQTIIDRILFLRICEDRGIEHYGRLQALQNGVNVYARLCELFYRADERYNSGLFHFKHEKSQVGSPDDLTPRLTIDDKTLKDIFKRLYYPDSPYEFSVLPVEILGQVYERFLGSVIRLTDGGRAKVEPKPEVRKAGGVYYTPAYIVEYIVKNTVGKLLVGQSPQTVAGATETWQPAKNNYPLTVLDPACGSGSFLLGAYQFLLDWHLDYYAKDLKKWVKGKSPRIYQDHRGAWRLTIKERKRILTTNIYGVDIDPQAVEVTKLSLLLKVLEGESNEALRQLELFEERALPDLANNIKCGNSLIGPDFYLGQQINLFDEEEAYRVNAFDFNAEFPEIMKRGGFDVVIGNPPYIRIQTLKEWAPFEVEAYKTLYRSAATGNYDIYVVFVEKGLRLLNKQGILGFILPHKFFNAKYGELLRQTISEGNHLSHIVHFGDQQVFAGATTYTCLLFLTGDQNDGCCFAKVEDLNIWRVNGQAEKIIVKSTEITGAEWNFITGKGINLFDKLSKMPVKLRDVVTGMFVGQQTSADTVYLFKKFKFSDDGIYIVYSTELGEWIELEPSITKRVIRSGSIHRFSASPTALILFPYEVNCCNARLYSVEEMETTFPRAWDYLQRNKSILQNREKGKFKDSQWYRFGRTQNLGLWEQPKLMIPYMITELSAYLDRTDNFYFINVTTGGYGITTQENIVSLEYLCALLNSRLLDFYFKRVTTTFHGGYFAANKQFIEALPIQQLEFKNYMHKLLYDKLLLLTESMLDLQKRLPLVKTDHDHTLIERRIATADQEINHLIYELYELTPEEIAIVEEAAGHR